MLRTFIVVFLAVLFLCFPLNIEAANSAFENLSEEQLLALTIYGEARGQDLMAQLAVGTVVMNRVENPEWGNTIHAVVLQRYQFSCFNSFDRQYKKLMAIAKNFDEVMMKNRSLAIARGLAHLILDHGMRSKSVSTATHFHSGKNPSWAKDYKYLGQIGALKFYEGSI